MFNKKAFVSWLKSEKNLSQESIEIYISSLKQISSFLAEKNIIQFDLYEIDDNPVACVALRRFTNEKIGEVAHLYVNPAHGNQGIGQKMVQYAIKNAQQAGLQKMITLSTQAFAFFTNKSDFSEGTVDDLPAVRRAEYEAQGRKSKILIKSLVHK